MSTIEETIEIQVPVRTAYDQWTQFKSFPRFMSTVNRVEQVRPAITRWFIGLGPVRSEFEAEIVEQEPDSHISWQSLGKHPAHSGVVSFRSVASGRTAVTVRMQMSRGGLPYRVADVSGAVERVVRAELGHFKERIEGLGEAVGAWRGTIRNGHVHPVEIEPHGSRVPRWPVG